MTGPRFRVLWTEAALRDLESILSFVAAENSGAARRLLSRLRKKAGSLETFPLRGRLVPEIQDVQLSKFREIQALPYRLIYRVDEERVFVLAVLDGRRNLEDLLLRRLVDR